MAPKDDGRRSNSKQQHEPIDHGHHRHYGGSRKRDRSERDKESPLSSKRSISQEEYWRSSSSSRDRSTRRRREEDNVFQRRREGDNKYMEIEKKDRENKNREITKISDHKQVEEEEQRLKQNKDLILVESDHTYRSADDNLVFGDDEDDVYKPMEKPRKLNHDEVASFSPQAVAFAIINAAKNQLAGAGTGPSIGKKHNGRVAAGGSTEIVQGERLPGEVSGGNGAVGSALQILHRDTGNLEKNTVWSGKITDSKLSKLVAMCENDGIKEICINRTDEFGLKVAHKESFRVPQWNGPGTNNGTRKQECPELKLKQMKILDTTILSAQGMREAQVRLKTPYLVLSYGTDKKR